MQQFRKQSNSTTDPRYVQETRFFSGVILLGHIIVSAHGQGRNRNVSDIKEDETVELFRTTAWLDQATNEWHAPIHVWIYEPEDSEVRKAVFAAILEIDYDLAPMESTEQNFSRRLNLIVADNERGKRIVVEIAGQVHPLSLSGSNGHFETTLRIPTARAERFIEGSVMSYSVVTDDNESRRFLGEVMFIPPDGLSVISDIDDTVKVSDVTERRALLENTFLLDFAAVPGMANLYSEWEQKGFSFHFVSSSPWQLYAPLQEFLDQSGFPHAELKLKAVRFRDRTLFDLFKTGIETKPALIESILARYPERRFVFVGDSGEEDPEVYAALLRKYPDRILKIFIRNVTEAAADNERFSSLFANIDDDRWQLFDDPRVLQLP